MEDAIVIAAEVAPGQGTLKDEPVTVATLRGTTDGREHHVRIVGGPTRSGGFSHVAGYVVPVLGARVRVDLRDVRRAPLVSLPGPSWVPNAPSGTWSASALPLVLFLAPPTSRDVGEAAESELSVAARTWDRPTCTAFRARSGGPTPVTPGDDGTSAVFFHDASWPDELVPGALAQTIVHTDGAGNLHDADIHVNSAEYRFSLDGAPGTQDLRSVFIHEIGHALGLGHSDDQRATMSISGSGLRWRSLERDDIEGVCALYPGTGSGGCDVDPCPAAYACVAGACQRPGERADVCAPCAATPFACEAAGDDARCVDIGSGATAGRVCGRSCARDSECGTGFTCRPTTDAGDLQCVSLEDCRNGANPCTTDAECTFPGAICRSGACVAPPAATPDAGAPDAGRAPAENPVSSHGAGCDCHATAPVGRTGSSYGIFFLGFLLLRRHLRTNG